MQSISTTFIEKLRFNENGLIPAIAQDWLDATVFMMAWMNRESIKETIAIKEMHQPAYKSSLYAPAGE